MKKIVQSLLKPFGLRLARLADAPAAAFGANVLFSTLARFGFSPSHVLDIGANHGNWTRNALRYFPRARYTLVEPQDNLKVHIADLVAAGSRIEWINAGIAEKSGTMSFHISGRDDSSTFAPLEGSAFTGTVKMPVKSIDDLLAEYKLPVPEMVKIDAEGMDLKAIEGAHSILGRTEIFLLEAAVLCPFENSVLRVLNYMNDRGYRLMDITELNRSPKYGVLWLTELAFVRDSSALLAGAATYE